MNMLRPPSVAQMNTQMVAGMNRKNRRQADRLMTKGYDDERIAHELKRLEQVNRKPSKLISLWQKIFSRWSVDPYYTHIPKQIRPMLCTGYKEGVPIMVADHVKCEKLRRKGKN